MKKKVMNVIMAMFFVFAGQSFGEEISENLSGHVDMALSLGSEEARLVSSPWSNAVAVVDGNLLQVFTEHEEPAKIEATLNPDGSVIWNASSLVPGGGEQEIQPSIHNCRHGNTELRGYGFYSRPGPTIHVGRVTSVLESSFLDFAYIVTNSDAHCTGCTYFDPSLWDTCVLNVPTVTPCAFEVYARFLENSDPHYGVIYIDLNLDVRSGTSIAYCYSGPEVSCSAGSIFSYTCIDPYDGDGDGGGGGTPPGGGFILGGN